MNRSIQQGQKRTVKTDVMRLLGLSFSKFDAYTVATHLLGELPDSFFEVTVDDLRVMLRDLKNERYAVVHLVWLHDHKTVNCAMLVFIVHAVHSN